MCDLHDGHLQRLGRKGKGERRELPLKDASFRPIASLFGEDGYKGLATPKWGDAECLVTGPLPPRRLVPARRFSLHGVPPCTRM